MVDTSSLPTNSIEKRVNVIETNVPWGLGRISRSLLASDGVNYRYDSPACLSAYIYIIDTGVNINHTEFGGRAIWGANLLDNVTSDVNGHGTHVAGIAAGTKCGVCKNGTVISVKVLGSTTRQSNDQIILDGISWAFNDLYNNNRITKSVISMSISTHVYQQ